MAIYSEAYKEQIEILLKNYGLNFCNIEFVENMSEWCKQHKVQENDSFRIVKSLLCNEKKQPLILQPTFHFSALGMHLDQDPVLKKLWDNRKDAAYDKI